MSGHDIIVVGASAGGVALANWYVIYHQICQRRSSSSCTFQLTARVFCPFKPLRTEAPGRPQAEHAQEGEEIARADLRGTTKSAPTGQKTVTSVWGAVPKKTAIDLLSIPCFARQHGYMGDVVGVVLSGTLDDGTAGLAA